MTRGTQPLRFEAQQQASTITRKPSARAAIAFRPRLMRKSEAAAYLGISPSRLVTLDIPHKQDGRCRLYEVADLDAYADAIPYADRQDQERAEAEQCDALFGVNR